LSAARDFSRYAQRVYASGKIPHHLLDASAESPWTLQKLSLRLQELQHSLADRDPERGLMTALRRLRAEVMVGVMTRDLEGRAPLAEVTETMTLLAELSVQRAVEWLHGQLVALHGVPIGDDSGLPQELLVVAMGKLGGRELNVSSDIDLIFIYEENGETDGTGSGAALSNQDFFWRLGKRLNTLLSDISDEGYVFRVDLRLRPNGNSGPLVASLAMLEEYFVVQGRDWERYAWIKSRVISDPQRPGVLRGSEALARRVTPFVYRRHLDYSAIGALRAIHRQLREETDRESLRHAAWRGANIKLGRGGIREIEFVAQVFQLIRGGQDPALRVIPTLEVLALLGQRGLLSEEESLTLKSHYVFLRRLEHRLQYLDDNQTHSLPANAEDQLRVAAAMGFSHYEALLENLADRTREVAQVFDRIFPAGPSTAEGPGERLWRQAAIDPYEASRPENGPLLQQLGALQQSFGYRAQTARTREQFDRALAAGLDLILPPDAAASAPVSPQLTRFLTFMEAISRRASYLMLLVDYPVVLKRLLTLLEASEWAARYITQRPQLLDEFLNDQDEQREDFSGYWSRFRHALEARLEEASGDVETQMTLLRQARHAETFRILLRDLRGELRVEEVADRLTALADAIMVLVLEYCWRQIPQRHCDAPRFAIIAYGKWGSKEMGYESDLDLVFLYEDDDERAQTNYALLVRKISTWMTLPTGAGILYEVDTQLRPNGNAGMLVSPLEAFRHYQMQDRPNAAWVWEHQALTRARFCCGDAAIGNSFEAIRHEVLTRRRDLNALRGEIASMRERIHKGHPNASELFDVKHDSGGMVDVEFIVQYLILAHAHAHPELADNVGNVALLRRAALAGLIDAELAEKVAAGYARLRGFQHAERLKGADKARIEPARAATIRESVVSLWKAVLG
jgi:glutamate-ammonia-ligase adenylyltransferase